MTAAVGAACAPRGPLDVFRWIVDSGLNDSLKALAHSILRRVDKETWHWPRLPGSPGGITVEGLADGAGISRRHAARCLRTLEQLGLVRTTFRPFEVSEYEIVPEAWWRRALEHQARRKAARDHGREERIRAFNERRAAAADRKAARACEAEAAAPAETLPPWANRHARRLKVAPRTVFELVGGAGAVVLGEHVDRTQQGGLARPVLRLWDGRGRPEAEVLLQELALVARWARESVHPEAVDLRGQGRRGGPDRSRDLRALCDPARWEQRLGWGREHGAAAAPSPVAPGAAPSPAVPVRGQPPWIPPGQPPPRSGSPPADLAKLWMDLRGKVLGELPRGAAAVQALYLEQLRPVEWREGVLVLEAPDAACGLAVRQLCAEVLVRAGERGGVQVGVVCAS